MDDWKNVITFVAGAAALVAITWALVWCGVTVKRSNNEIIHDSKQSCAQAGGSYVQRGSDVSCIRGSQ